MKILGIESSCDETACSVVEDGKTVLSNIVASQIDEHRLYGGVVPEIASRRHAENITWVTKAALEEANCTMDDIDAVAVTYAPGLIGALLVGVSFAKGLAMSANKPLVPVHHIAGHIAANYISHPELKPPQTEESKTYNTDFIRYHLHFSDSHCPDRIRRLVNDGRIVPYLDDMERKVSEAISRQVELWKQTDSCYQKALLSGDAEKILGLENCFVYMAREAVFECMVYI